jgi:hypothetical protein
MTTDKQLTNIVDEWLSTTNDSPHEAPLTVARAMARLPQTRQRRNWWPLPFRGRASATPPATPGTQSWSPSTVAVNGHSPTLTGRTHSMFSPAQAIVGGALVFAIGGALLVAQPFERQESVEPGIQIPATVASPLAQARRLHTATPLADGRVLVIGGRSDGALASAEMWDPVTGAFDPTGSLGEGRYDHTTTLLPDGRVLVVGGYGSDNTWLDTAKMWDPATADFSPAGSLAEGRHRHTATLLPDGRVLVVGGYGGEFEWLASAEAWDPATGDFSPAGALDEAR